MKKQLLAFLLVLFGGFVSTAQVINFDNQGHTSGQALANPYTIVDNGETFRFTIAGGSATNHIYRTSEPSCGASGISHIYCGNTPQTSWTIETTSGNEIDLGTIRFDNVFSCFAFDYDLTIEGFKNGVSSGTQTFLVGGLNQVFTSNASFDDVDRIVISGSDLGHLGIDDINWVSSVPPCTEPAIPMVSASPNPICSGASTTLNISGALNDATQWHIYTGFCGVTEIGTTTGTTFVVSPNSTTSYYVRGEGGCTAPGGTCGAVTVTVNPTEDASFNYGSTAYCVTDGDPTPTISGVSGGTFVATTAGLSLNASTGEIDLSTSTPGTYVVEYTTSGACPGMADQTITINALDDASFTYGASSYCQDDSDPTPTITGLPGGSFSSTAGLTVNAGTGVIDVSTSTPGTYSVSYTTVGPCPNNSSVTVTINALDDAAFNYSAGAYCVDDIDPTPSITGLSGGSFSSGAGLTINSSTGVIDVSTSTPGTYTVSYATNGPCPNSSSVTVTINALDDPSFSYASPSFCTNGTDPMPTVTGVAGGSFTSGLGLSINAATGEIDLSASTLGTYTVTYSTTGPCPNTSAVTVTVNSSDDASFSYSAGAYCADDIDPTPSITGLAGGSFISGPGLSINASTGEVDLSVSTPGSYTITYNTSGPCPNSSSVSLTVSPLDDASFFYSGFAHCANGPDPSPTINGLPGGTFSSTAGLSINASTGVVDASASTPGTYLITYSTTGPCPNSATVSMAINATDDASFNYSAATYCSADSDPTPTVTGVMSGSFSSTAGLSINATDGTIDLSASTPGAYSVTYTTSGLCPNSSSVSVTVSLSDDASFNYSAIAYCVNDSDPTPTVTGLAGGSFTSTAGLSINAATGVIDLSVSTPGTYSVTYTTAGGCPNSSSELVTVNGLDDASFNYSAASFCSDDLDPTPSITGLIGGTFSSTAGLSINATTGSIDVSISTPGTYSVSYTTNGACPNSSSVTVTINPLDDASFNYSATSYCIADTDPVPTIIGLAGGTFSSTAGLSINAATGEIDLSASTPGSYVVTYATAGPCPNTGSFSLTITALDDASFAYSAASYCANVSNPTPTITGVSGGTFSSTAGLSINASTGEIDLSASTVGSYTVTYTTTGACSNSSTQTVAINTIPTAPVVVTPTIVCPGGDVILTATGSGTGNIMFYDNTMAQLTSVAMPPATATYNAGALAAGTYMFSASEENGGCESAMVMIEATVGDTTAPIAVCQDVTVFLDGTGAASIVASDIDAGSTDNCGGVTLSASQTTFDCSDVGGSPAGTLIISGVYDAGLTGGTPKGVELYASNDISDLSQYGLGSANNGGGTDGEEFTFPAVSVAAGTYIYVASEATEFANFFGFSPDYTTGAVSINGDDAVELFQLGGVIDVFGDINTDGSGEPWDYLDGWAYRNNGTGPDGSAFTLGSWSFSGINVYDGQTTNATTPTPMPIGTFAAASSGSTPVVLTVTDASGNTATCTANVTVSDTVSPIIACPADQVGILDAACSFALPDYTGMGMASDNCGNVVISQSPVASTVISADQVVTLTADDGNGNTSTCTFNVTVSDTTAPTAVCQDVSVFLDGSGNASIVAADIDGGSLDECGGVTLSASPTAFTCANLGTNTVTLTVTDASGNMSMCTATVTVADSTSPVVTCPGDQTEMAGASCDFTLIDYTSLVSSSDNCGTVSITQSPAAGTVIFGDQVITMTADDGNGNSSTCTFNVLLMGATPPVAVCQDVTVFLDGSGDASIVASDIDGGSTATCGGTPALSASVTSFTCADLGTNNVILTVTDGAGNTDDCTAIVTVVDSISPTPDVATLADVTSECDVTVLVDPSATDNCGTVTVTNDAVFPISGQGTTVVTWTYDDGNGNTVTQTQNIVIDDVTAPVGDLATLPDVTADCEVTALTAPTATDNCNGTVIVTNDAVLPISGQGTSIVTWTYDDGNGNTSTQTQNVVIDDLSSPLPTSAPLPDVVGECSVDVMPAAPTANDLCTGLITGVMTSSVTFPVTTQGTTVITWEFDDGNGNITTQSQNIVVNDVTGPTPDAGTLADLTGDCSIDTPVAPTATDNCLGAITGTTTTIFPITAIGTTTIVWEFDDGNGNITTQTQDAINTGIDASATLSADGVTITANTAGATYAWLNCDFNSVIAGETGQSFTPAANGNYAVIVTLGNCTDTSACENITSVGLDDLSIDQLMVYPNPSADGNFTVSYEGIIQAIDVVDMLGRVIVLPTDLQTGAVDGSELAYGRYMVRVTTDTSVLITEIVIAK